MRSILCVTLASLILGTACSVDSDMGGAYCSPWREAGLSLLCPPGVPCETCPSGTDCFDGTCYEEWPPACMNPDDPAHLGWPSDLMLEPNGHPEFPVVLPCGDDGVHTDPAEYAGRCPSRQGYQGELGGLLICPGGDRDFYAFYLMGDEELELRVVHQYSPDAPRDLDAKLWTWDPTVADWRNDVSGGFSTNDDEVLSVSTWFGTGFLQGWYYLEVYGKTLPDVNHYTVRYTINP